MESLCGDFLLVQLNIWDDNRSAKVFKMDWKRKEFNQIKSLGDEAIFLSSDESVCIQTSAESPYSNSVVYILTMMSSIENTNAKFGYVCS